MQSTWMNSSIPVPKPTGLCTIESINDFDMREQKSNQPCNASGTQFLQFVYKNRVFFKVTHVLCRQL